MAKDEIRIKTKLRMVDGISEALHCLNRGDRSGMNLQIENLKASALDFDDKVQQDVLALSEQLQFQSLYDPLHWADIEVQKRVDCLLEDLGFTSPKDPLF